MRSYSQKNKTQKNKTQKNKIQKNKIQKNKTQKNKRNQNGGAFGKGKTKKRLAALEKKVDDMSETISKIIKVVNLNKGNVKVLANQLRGVLEFPSFKNSLLNNKKKRIIKQMINMN